MIDLRTGTVVSLITSRPGAVVVAIDIDGEPSEAVAYPALVGTPEPGDRVVVNTTAVALGLGTGGDHVVVAIPDRLPPVVVTEGHVMKARYTPLQHAVLGVAEEASPHRAAMAATASLDGAPVVVADLHSALPAIVAGVRARRPEARVVYAMTDGGALPIWYSRTVAGLTAAGWLAGTVTAGQAFGGDLEAVTLHEALLAARAVLLADVVVVTQGPGNLGVGLRWGFSGVGAGEAVNAVAALDGRAVASLRISASDPRERHRGVSHHSATAYGRVALARATVVVPELPAPLAREVQADLQASGIAQRHDVVTVVEDLDEALRSSPVPLSTMGRSLDEDYWYFSAAAAAGYYAADVSAT